MPSADWIRKLYAYNEWANGRILATASELSDAEMRKDRPGMDSLGKTLRHIARAQNGWWSFWTGNERTQMAEPDAGVMEAVGEWLRNSHGELRAFVESLNDGDLERTYEDKDDDGRPVTFRLWEMMIHVVNHGTQHRQEVAAVLTTFGRSPGDLDFIEYVYAGWRGEV